MSIVLAALLLTCGDPEIANDSFADCLTAAGSMLGDAQCYSAEQARLEGEQARLLWQLRERLRRPGSDGTDYPAALAALAQAQAAWSTYWTADCAIVDAVFRTGNAKGLAGATCIIDHYTTRNTVLRGLRDDYLAESSDRGAKESK